jgi:hypothetical protein
MYLEMRLYYLDCSSLRDVNSFASIVKFNGEGLVRLFAVTSTSVSETHEASIKFCYTPLCSTLYSFPDTNICHGIVNDTILLTNSWPCSRNPPKRPLETQMLWASRMHAILVSHSLHSHHMSSRPALKTHTPTIISKTSHQMTTPTSKASCLTTMPLNKSSTIRTRTTFLLSRERMWRTAIPRSPNDSSSACRKF